MERPRPLLDILHALKEASDGTPSHWLNEMRAATAGWQTFAETAQGRELVEAMRRIQESGLAERLMGRQRPLSPLRPNKPKSKRKAGAGRKPIHTPEQIEEGIRLVLSTSQVSVDAAFMALRAAGFKGGKTVLHKLMVKPAYARRP